MPQKVDWKDLIKQASVLVTAEQKTDYEFLRSRLRGPEGKPIGTGTISEVLKRLEKKGTVRRGPRRHWLVLVNPDGSPKPADQLPEKRRFRKKRRNKPADQPTKQPVAAAPTRARKSVSVSRNGVTNDEQLELIQRLAGAAHGRNAEILSAAAQSLQFAFENRDLIEVLRD